MGTLKVRCKGVWGSYRISLLLKHFRGWWKHKYLTSLREFYQPQGSNYQRMKVGDIMQTLDEGLCLNWHLAVIKELITRNDDLVRAAHIRTNNG